jgi:hypothetical protein
MSRWFVLVLVALGIVLGDDAPEHPEEARPTAGRECLAVCRAWEAR